MAEPFIQRVYDLSIAGYDDSIQKVKALTDAFNKMDAVKKNLNTQLQQKLNAGDTAAISDLTARLKDLELQMANVSKKRDASAKETALLAKAEKDLAAANAIRTKSLIEQDKELDRQIALEERRSKIPPSVAPTTPAADIPLITNLDELEAERNALKQKGEVINELDKAQLEGQLSATEWAKSQKAASDVVKESGGSLQNIKLEYDQYTGTLRQNITAQIENAQALKVNKESQKEIEGVIKNTGVVTTQQVVRLAELKEEALLLTESNKALTVTIRNQAQEFIAGAGSVDELQAKVNQLQQAYEQLTESERDSPFGKSLLNEINILEPKVKALEGTFGKFQRNVGNYPTAFTGAFKVLDTELDKVQGKLVKGNFSGKELDELTAREKVLVSVNETLSKEFSSTTAQTKAFREASLLLGQTFGKESEIFKTFSAQVRTGSVELKNLDKATSTTASTSGKFVTGFKGVFSVLRNIANIIPGLGISSLILLLVAPLQAIAASFVNMFNVIARGKIAVQTLNEVNIKAVEIFSEQKTKVEQLAAGISDGNIPLDKRKDLLNQLIAQNPNYLRGLTLENLATAEGKKILDAYILSLEKKAELQASEVVNTEANKNLANLNAERQAFVDLSKSGKVYYDDLTEAQKKFFDQANIGIGGTLASAVNAQLRKGDFRDVLNEFDKAIKSATTKISASGKIFKQKLTDSLTNTPTESKGLIQKIQDQIKALTDIQPTLLTDDAIKKNVAQIKKLQDELDKLLGKKDKSVSSRISVELTEEFKQIETTRAIRLATENKSANEIQKVRELTFEEERLHIKKVEAINVEALDAKIVVLNRKKNLNNEEKKQVAEFGEQISAIELDTSKKLQAINDKQQDQLQKQFDEREKSLKENLDRQIDIAKSANQKVQNDDSASPTNKVQSQINADNAILKAQVFFFFQMDALEKAYNKISKKNADDRARGIRETYDQLNADNAKTTLASLKEIEVSGEKLLSEFKATIAKARLNIATSNKPQSKKDSALNQLDREESLGILTREVINDQLALPKKKQLLEEGKITEKEYYDFVAQLAKKELALHDFINSGLDKAANKVKSIKDLIQKGLSDLLNIKAGSEDAQALADVLTQTYDLAKLAMNSYFDSELNRIEQSRLANEKRIDTQTEQLLARAQSKDEEVAIEHQAELKKQAIDREAFERTKKIKLQELTINYAVQLSNIAVAASANPLNPFTFGAAGIAQYIIQAGIATAAYFINRSNINKAQYAFGGNPDITTTRGGQVKGRSHSDGGNPFVFKGRVFEDEIDELNIIRTKNVNKNTVHTIRGTHTEIASKLNVLGGGVEFKPGAKVIKYETGGTILKRFASGGYVGVDGFTLGANLQAPINPQSYLKPSNGISDEVNNKIETLTGLIAESHRQINQRIDKIQVFVDPHAVKRANDETAKATEIGTI